MTGLMAFLMKATLVWPSSSSTLWFLNSPLLQQPNCEIELFSLRCALSRTAARSQAQYEHQEAALTASILAALPLFPPSIDKRRWGLLSRAWTSAPSWSLPSAHWKEKTSRRRENGSCGPEIQIQNKSLKSYLQFRRDQLFPWRLLKELVFVNKYILV